ncbi:MAG: recombination-associated protein RdgC [Rubrivivax sp.]
MLFKNTLVYRITDWQVPGLAEIEARLQAAPFVEGGPTTPESIGWVPPRGEAHHPLAEAVAGQLVLRQRREVRAVPGGALRQELQARLDALERQTGRRPKGRAAREIKEELVLTLLPRAFPKRSDLVAWIDPEARLVWVGTANAKRADALVTPMLEALGGGLRLAPLQTALAPATAMATWLAEGQAPHGFAIDRDCELKQPDGEKATVRYVRHALEGEGVGEEIAAHIRAGKRPTQLALTWGGRVSFVLHESGALKRLQFVDGLATETAGDEGFDADVTLFTGELRRLWPDLLEALGGWDEGAR